MTKHFLGGIVYKRSRERSKYARVAESAASSPKRSRWEMQRGEDGAAVKIRRSEERATYFGNRKSHAHATFIGCTNLICESGGIGRRARLRGVWGSSYGFKSRLSHQNSVARRLLSCFFIFSCRISSFRSL